MYCFYVRINYYDVLMSKNCETDLALTKSLSESSNVLLRSTYIYWKMYHSISSFCETIFYRAWILPYTLKEKSEGELSHLIKLDIYEPISTPLWVASIVPVIKKDAFIRICCKHKSIVKKEESSDKYLKQKVNWEISK